MCALQDAGGGRRITTCSGGSKQHGSLGGVRFALQRSGVFLGERRVAYAHPSVCIMEKVTSGRSNEVLIHLHASYFILHLYYERQN